MMRLRRRKPGLPPSALKPPPRSVMKPPPVSTPKAPPAGLLPRPRRPRLRRDTGGGLGDLFAVFPDLPRAPRPLQRVSVRTLARRMSAAARRR